MAALQHLAQLAKERLKNRKYIMEETSTVKKMNCSARTHSSLSFVDKDGGKFLEKCLSVIKLGDIENPLSEIIDSSYYESLSDIEKERYILKTSNTFLTIKNHYKNLY